MINEVPVNEMEAAYVSEKRGKQLQRSDERCVFHFGVLCFSEDMKI